MASPNTSEIVATTLIHRSPEIAEEFLNSTALFAKLKEYGCYKSVSGGEKIYETIVYAENTTAMPYSGGEPLDISPQEIVTNAEFAWKQYASSVYATGLETEIQNTGAEQVFDLLEIRIKNCEDSVIDLITTDSYGDGTGSGGKVIGGLQHLLADTPTSGIVGGINRATYSAWWSNQYRSCLSDGGAAASPANIVSNMNALYLSCQLGKKHPDLILADNNYYLHYWNALLPQQRISSGKLGALGFRALAYIDGLAEVVCDGGIGGHCPANHMYFINSEHIKLRFAKKRNFVPLNPDRYSVNQDAVVKLLAWAGNMTINSARLHGVLKA